MRSLINRITCLFAVAGLVAPTSAMAEPSEDSLIAVSGELQQWHKVTLTVDGPQASEDGTPNPFLDYRMQVQFQHPETGLTYSVPGYFAADGNAANTSAQSGNKWRAHLCPDHAGEWTYEVSFRAGSGVAISDDPNSGSAVSMVDGLKGSLNIANTDKTGRDFRSKGRLKYVGKHHLQFAGTGEFFLKAGADAPENLLSYVGFDGDFKTDGHKDNLVKKWEAHVKDWKSGDPDWQNGKGKGLIGAVSYLAAQGLNSFSFLTLNIEGDDRNVFPYTTYDERERLDCSRMDQWETVFEHGTSLGMHLHFKTQEAENVNLLDDGHTGPERKLYYRELIARFGHHLALNWNLGEEVGLGHKVSTDKKQAWANYFSDHDPYHHHIVIHNGNNHYDLLGDASPLTGFSLQTNQSNFGRVHSATLNYLRRSVDAGKPWVVACDEPGDASHSLITDAEDPTHDDARKNALWGNIMAGGAGVEWYFGYAHPHSDLTCQDFRVRQNMWQQSRIALDFFADNRIPFWKMTNGNDLISTKDNYCLSEPGKLYLAFLKHSEPTTLDLSDAKGIFEIVWFNPRKGGPMQTGTTLAVQAGGDKNVSLGNPPEADGQDWLAVVRPGDPNRDYPPGVSAGADKTLMLPRSGDSVTSELSGTVSDDKKSGGSLSSTWTKLSGPGNVEFSAPESAESRVTFHGTGEYKLRLWASDGKQQTDDTVTIRVEPFQSKVTRGIRATDDAYIEGSNVISGKHLKVEGNRRIALLKFEVSGIPPNLLDVQLRLTASPDDSGNGTLRVFRGSHSDWKGATLRRKDAPKSGELLGKKSVDASPDKAVTIPLKGLLDGDGSYTLVVTLDKGGNDIWFNATKTDSGPELLITFDDPDGRHSAFGRTSTADRVESSPASAPTGALGYNRHRIAFSADGNHQSERHPEANGTSGDPDDWGATAASLAIIAKHGLQNKVVHYSYNNFIGAPPHTTASNEMKTSAMEGAERFGFDKNRFFDVGEKMEEAITHLAAEMAKSTEADPLYFIHGGPADFFYRAVKEVIDDGKSDALKHVHIITHSNWNDGHKRRYAHHTMAEAVALSGGRLKLKKIVDQNAGWKSDYSDWHWMRDHADKNVQWIFKRADHHPAKVFDISDCGMVFYLLAGDERGNSSKFKALMANVQSANVQSAKAKTTGTTVLTAMGDFKSRVSGKFVPGYKDPARRAMAIDAARYQGKFSAAETNFEGESGTYDLVLTTLAETDGESSYRLLVGDKTIGDAQNPETSIDYKPIPHRFNGIALKHGDTIRVEFNSASNGKIPEGDAFAFARGRWRSLAILKPGTSFGSAKPQANNPTPTSPSR